MPHCSIARSFANILRFLDFLTHDRHESKFVILCTSRESFLQDVIASIDVLEQQDDQDDELISLMKCLLTPNLNNLGLIRGISVVFTPTLSHLRAYIATGMLRSMDAKEGSDPSLITIYGLLDLHVGTSEFSAQGLSRTMALAVDTIVTANARLLIAECDRKFEEDYTEDVSLPRHHNSTNPFAIEVPILNRVAGYGRDDMAWVGKTVSVGRVWGRWCRLM